MLVVCDGVSTSADSDVASLAAARAARDVLVAPRPAGLGVPASRAAAIAAAIGVAVAQANEAVSPTPTRPAANAAACTFAAAVVEGDLCVFGNVGDSRVYWLPDPGDGRAGAADLDDSVAQAADRHRACPRGGRERPAGPRHHQVAGPRLPRLPAAHRLGAADRPRLGAGLLRRPVELRLGGRELQALIARLSDSVGADPLTLAEALVRWANDQGGKDNISVALARHTAGQAGG